MEPADAPSASWHPAMMPQFIPPARPAAAEPTPQPSHPPPELSSQETQSGEPDPKYTPNDDMTSTNATHDAPDGAAVLDRFNDGDDDAAAAWDLSEEPVMETTPQPMAQEVAPVEDTAAEAPVPDDDAAAWDLPEEAPAEEMLRDTTQDAVPAGGATTEVHMPDVQPEPEPVVEPATETTGNTAKHSSRISFARTVSHEPSFNDSEQEEDEWSLQRSDTDPFNFMPASERTNSFPAVPPAQHDIDEPLAEPPAATQAQDILQELEQEELHDDLSADRSFPFDQQDEADHADHFDQTVGRDTADSDDMADNRFEEGLPLISHEQPEPRQDDPPPAASAGFDDAFADEAGEGGDDFFSNIQGGQNAAEDDFDLTQPIQRKDTSMFTGTSASQQADPVSFEPETPTIAEADDAAFDDEAAAGLQQDANETSQVAESETKPEDITKEAAPVDLDAKWAEAFAGDDDDDFLLEDSNETKELDPADFFGSDDEGFLEDTADDAAAQPTTLQMAAPAAPATGAGVNGRYTPSNVPSPSFPSLNTFNSAPGVPQVQQAVHPLYAPPTTAPPAAAAYGAPPPPKPQPSKAQSFVTQAKGGYSSPYDLPMEVVKPPKKRSSMQQIPRATPGQLAPPVAPPRAASLYNQPPPQSGASSGSISPTSSNHSSQPPPPSSKPTPQLKPKSGFFEDLPMVTKPRPGSRQSAMSSPGPSSYGASPGLPPGPPQGPPQGPPMASPSLASPPMQPPMSSPLMQPPMVSPPLQQEPPQPSPNIAGLVAPERSNPYAPVQADNALKPSAPATSRYSPAPPANGTAPAPVAASRYSPAPPSRSGSVQYSAVPPPVLAHQPRTSSPLAHFEVATDRTKLPSPAGSDGFPMARTSSQHDPRLHRVPSLPPTQEVEEDGTQLQPSPALSRSASGVPLASAQSRYSPLEARQTPPLTSPPASNTLSPPKRATSNYAPQALPSGTPKQANYAPPARSQTQSPGAMYGPRTAPVPRPSSVQGASPGSVSASHNQASPMVTRARGMSQSLNLVAPTDGREKDALQRWRGAPLVSWGVGGTIISSFPKDVPRYGISGNVPMIIRSPGEVKIKHVKDLQPLEELLTKFPGPLKGKSKKKETTAWLTTGIEMQESALPNVVYHNHLSHEDKRAVERVLLLKILRVLVEHDGVLEGNPNVEKAVRQIFSPGLEVDDTEPAPGMATGADLQSTPAATGMQADAMDSVAVEQMRKHLLVGDREKAVWAAVDKRLWGHAMIIANTVTGDLYKQVAHEFVKKEVNHPGRNNESLAALYGVMSGNSEEAVDELVPSHARAGRQLMSTSDVANQSQDALAGLDKWRETLGLILSNRSTADTTAIVSLGKLLSSYGRAEAAHICFMFARQQAIFGGLDDPAADFVLVGADHRRQADQFVKETEALLLSEVYEYGLSLCPGSTLSHGCPHLAAYKLQHAMTLAEYGMKDRALQYCDSIIAAVTSQTKRSPYYHHILETSVDNLMNRLKMAPREGSTSWISKPNMNSVSNSLLSKFNKFVAGDETESTDPGALTDPGAESGPFARITATPTMSRTPSVSGFETYGNGATVPSYGASPPATRAASRYAPSASQGSPYTPSPGYNPAPRSSMERSSGEMNRGSIELPRQTEPTPMYGGYAPEANSAATFGFQPVAAAAPSSSPYAPAIPTSAPVSQPPANSYSPYEPQAAVNAPEPNPPTEETPANEGYQAPSYGYAPPSLNSFDAPAPQIEEPAASGGGYEPPSYGFEPPSYEPGQDDDELAEKPKKKSFMDDDDDMPAPTNSKEKSKAEKDRENEEMFRKAAEEDAKRAEAAKSQKKGWLGGWFGGGGGKKESAEIPNKPVRAKLGESSSFIYDPDLKRWVNKKAGAENTPAKTATPPPPRGTPPPPMGGAGPPGTPPASTGTPPPPMGVAPPMRSVSGLSKQMSSDSLNVPGAALGGAPPMARTASAMSNISTGSGDGASSSLMPPSGPPSRPATSLSNASSIDDLLGAAGPRKPGAAKKGRKGGRYVDVMAK